MKFALVESSRTSFVDCQFSTMTHRRHANTIRINIWSTNLLSVVPIFLQLVVSSGAIGQLVTNQPFFFAVLLSSLSRDEKSKWCIRVKEDPGNTPDQHQGRIWPPRCSLPEFRSSRHPLSQRTHTTIICYSALRWRPWRNSTRLQLCSCLETPAKR